MLEETGSPSPGYTASQDISIFQMLYNTLISTPPVRCYTPDLLVVYRCVRIGKHTQRGSVASAPLHAGKNHSTEELICEESVRVEFDCSRVVKVYAIVGSLLLNVPGNLVRLP